MCGEYGGKTARPHYHQILFNLELGKINNEYLEDKWEKGMVHIGNVTPASIRYVTGYVTKGLFEELPPDMETGLVDDRLREFSLMSKNLGSNFLTPQMKKHLRQQRKCYVVMEGGRKQSLPRYYMDKLFTTAEKRLIAEEVGIIMEIQNIKNGYYSKEDIIKMDKIRRFEKDKKQKRLKI